MTATTKISVRAMAFGGKFIGQHVGFARIDIYGPEHPEKPLASGRPIRVWRRTPMAPALRL
jgi:hypothetical protein